MNTKPFSRHPRIAIADLALLTLDNASAHRFDNRFRPTLFGGIFLGCACAIVGYSLYHAEAISPESAVAVMAAGVLPGLAIAFTAQMRMMCAVPLSVQSGRQMLPHVVQDRTQEDQVEVAYIDQSSGTYFTRLYVA